MTLSPDKPQPDWERRSGAVLADQIAAYDAMRRRCPVAYSDYLGWSLFRHEDMVRALDDHGTFSSVVSSHLSVPSGMDPPRRTDYRRLIERHFEPNRVTAFEPLCKTISADLVVGLETSTAIDLVAQLARLFAVRVQRANLGWPPALHAPLLEWVHRNREATLARDTGAMAAVALEFVGYISDLLDARRSAGAAAPDDIITDLLRQEIDGRRLDDDEIVSILRNWTVGQLGTIAACVGILGHYVAANPGGQQDLRENLGLLPAAIDEILRMHAPLISNRRLTTRSAEIGGRRIAAGERITLIWASAKRDEAEFDDPDEFRLDRDPAHNLLYGQGIHVCPGAQLSRLELRVVIEELLTSTQWIGLAPDRQPTRAIYPASGFSSLPLLLS